jgi:SET domain-containing protein
MNNSSQTERRDGEWLEFRHSSIHGTGAFASVPIPAGIRVIEYVGERITKAESIRRCQMRNEYIFSLDEETDIDGNVPWNLARLINHSCAPNCESQYIDGKIWIITLRDVAAGEEATFNYGYDLEDFEDHPCHCGSPNCAGFIVAEEFFEEVQRRHNAAKWSATG